MATPASPDLVADCDNALLSVRMVSGMLGGVAAALKDTRGKAEGFASSAADAEASAEKLAERVETLTGTVTQISRHVTEIEAISLNTKILALNANIEAVRAGTAGRGFAVIASAVGQLAKDAAEATKKILASFREIERATAQTRAEQERLVALLNTVRQGSLAMASTMSEQVEVTDAMLTYSAQAEETIAVIARSLPQETVEAEPGEGEVHECRSSNGTQSSASESARSTTTTRNSSAW